MSLFDVIKYPVNDIFDEEEMENIPEVITVPWAEECQAKMCIGSERKTTKNSPPSSIGLWMRWMVMLYCQHRDVDLKDRIKEHFAQTLRQRIKEYDNL